ncbi:MAG: hypothetical protein ACYC21_02950 [Eubacteriales bacterium]
MKNECIFCGSVSQGVALNKRSQICENCITNNYITIEQESGTELRPSQQWVQLTREEANFLVSKLSPKDSSLNSDCEPTKQLGSNDSEIKDFEENLMNKLFSIDIRLKSLPTGNKDNPEHQCVFCGTHSEKGFSGKNCFICASCIIDLHWNKQMSLVQPQPQPSPEAVILSSIEVRYLIHKIGFLQRNGAKIKNVFKDTELLKDIQNAVFKKLSFNNRMVDTTTLSADEAEKYRCGLCGRITESVFVGKNGILCSQCEEVCRKQAQELCRETVQNKQRRPSHRVELKEP